MLYQRNAGPSIEKEGRDSRTMVDDVRGANGEKEQKHWSKGRCSWANAQQVPKQVPASPR